MSKISQFKTVRKDDGVYITRLKEQKFRKVIIINCQHIDSTATCWFICTVIVTYCFKCHVDLEGSSRLRAVTSYYVKVVKSRKWC